uniref:Uncharacterized protein n=1 Tax=viral metagenome TaxID=1070528 RepID=A0A6H1ZAJ6_9ZZZZ
MKIHIHVYKLAGLYEVDVDAESIQEGLEKALEKAVVSEDNFKQPDNKYLALPFYNETFPADWV